MRHAIDWQSGTPWGSVEADTEEEALEISDAEASDACGEPVELQVRRSEVRNGKTEAEWDAYEAQQAAIVNCPQCRGAGMDHYHPSRPVCEDCGGTGRIPRSSK